MENKTNRDQGISRRDFFSSLPREIFGFFSSLRHSVEDFGSLDVANIEQHQIRNSIGEFQHEYFKEAKRRGIDQQEAARNYYYFFHRPMRRLMRWLMNQEVKSEYKKEETQHLPPDYAG